MSTIKLSSFYPSDPDSGPTRIAIAKNVFTMTKKDNGPLSHRNMVLLFEKQIYLFWLEITHIDDEAATEKKSFPTNIITQIDALVSRPYMSNKLITSPRMGERD